MNPDRQNSFTFDESVFRKNHRLSSDIDISVTESATSVPQPESINNSSGRPSQGPPTDRLLPAVETQEETADAQTQTCQHDYDLRPNRNKRDVDKAKSVHPKKKKMKSYKKRSFHPNQPGGMENDHSDDSEKQVSPPPLLEEGETKPKKKWQRKISRKQFRHHDIKLFTPGELKTPTLLKHNDSGPPQLKKQDVASKESITESIVYSLGGQKQAFTQKEKKLEETNDGSASKKETEVNDNVNKTNNNHNSNNNAGKHQLPAIVIMETPVGRRRSAESVHPPKPNLIKNPGQLKPKKPRGRPPGAKSYASMPKLQPITNPVPEPPKLKPQGDELLGEAKKITNNELVNNNFVENKSKAHDLKNRVASSLEQNGRLQRPMEFERSCAELPENLSLKRRYSGEGVPVDLSQRRESVEEQPTTSASHANQTQPSSCSNVENAHKERHNVGAKEEQPHKSQRISQSLIPPQNNDALRMYVNEFERIFNNQLRNPSEASTYSSVPNPQIISQNLITGTVMRMSHLNQWQDALQNLLRQQFNLQILDMMSQAYQQLDTIKDETLITADARLKAQKVLTDTYEFISTKLKQLGSSLNPIEVIKIMGQSNANPEKNMLQTNLEAIQGLQNLNLNQVRVPTSTNPFVMPQSSRAANVMTQSSHAANVMPQSSHAANVMPQSSRAANVMPQSSHAANVMPQSSHAANVMPQSSHAANVMPQSSHAAHVIPQSNHAANVMPQITHAANVMPQSSHAANFRALTRSPPPPFGSHLVQARPRVPNREYSVPRMPSPRTGDLTGQRMRPDVRHTANFRQPGRPFDVPFPLPPRLGDGKNPTHFPQDLPVPTSAPASYMNYAISNTRQEAQTERVPKKSAPNRSTLKQLKRSKSDQNEKNYALPYPYMNANGLTQARIPPNHNPFLSLPNPVPPNMFQNGHLRASLSSASRNLNGHRPMYSEAVFRHTVPNQMFNGANTYIRHPIPGPLKDFRPAQPGPTDLLARRKQDHRVNLNGQQTVPEKCSSTSINGHQSDNNISSTTDHVKVSKTPINSRHRAIEQTVLVNPIPAQPNEPPIVAIPAVIVADTSMQITKESSQPSTERNTPQDPLKETDVRLTVITTSSEKASTSEEEAPSSELRASSSDVKVAGSEENVKNPTDKDQEENNAELQIWLDKLKSNKKLKRKFLSQMGINNREVLAVIKSEECIEIIDSDEETSVETKEIKTDMDDTKEQIQVNTTISNEPIEISSRPSSQETAQKQTELHHNKPISQEAIVTTTTMPTGSIKITPPPINGNITKITPKPSLSTRNYLPPIALPYVLTSTQSQDEHRSGTSDQQKTIYSPEIELISPVGNEPSFTFPEASTTVSEVLTTPVALNAAEIEAVLGEGENVTSPTNSQKRKTPIGLNNYQSKGTTSPNLTSGEGVAKRRKSLDRPQITVSPRVSPSGKLCYVRESHMFLRYFDDAQMELFITNLSSKDEELLRTTGVNPEKIKNSYKHANFGLEQLGQTDIVHLPKEVEFSRKADLQDVEEFVKESSLVEQYVPKDFADFYRYVTGFQIIKNKHPVSLQTFLTMYNTNRTTELLRKYLQRRDEDPSVVTSM